MLINPTRGQRMDLNLMYDIIAHRHTLKFLFWFEVTNMKRLHESAALKYVTVHGKEGTQLCSYYRFPIIQAYCITLQNWN
jgi:hypothetical protein